MAKQLNVDLSFNANTSQAKAQIQSLVSELNKLSSGTNLSSKGLPLTKDLIEAQNAAKSLGAALDGAFDVNTGMLDLSSFNQSLQKSGMSLKDYSAKLTMLGQEGDQAFLKVAQSIINTQAPLRKTSGMLDEFVTTLKNTARWQVSSSILHGFMGAVQSAYGYAQDLNESLTNIRIVTNYNTEQMSAFAQQANKAAKALSTTTTRYTDASLIYYQQGLDESEVSERTNITIKMANAAGQSAQIVSDQLTAVWNNFYDGSKSLEYYADVMTALGAATASSTDEIAGGLEKFAAVADTIGLSYEYAASALATITSNTRQSEEVVGTALKTIFARIQGLNLGDTLEDGTTLNKYSKALRTVGIDIFNSVGELKKMDEILDEMANKWEILSDDQQVALAQTVAGVRQYNQLVSLMDNWNNGDSDSMTANLNTAYGSTGALQEQADIYAESWEASRDRVRASLESIYQTLINDDFFIDLNNMLSTVIDGLKTFIDSIGGAKGALLILGTLMTKIFANDISKGINNAISNMRIFTGTAQQEIADVRKEAKDIAMSMTKDSGSAHVDAMRQSLETTYTLQEELRQSAKLMSDDQLTVAENAMKTAQSYNEIAISAGKAADEAHRIYNEQLKVTNKTSGQFAADKLEQISVSAVSDTEGDLIRDAYSFVNVAKEMGFQADDPGLSSLLEQIKTYRDAINQGKSDIEKNKSANDLLQSMDQIVNQAKGASESVQKYQESLKGSAEAAVSARSEFDKMKNSIDAETFKASREDLENLAQTLEDAGYDVKAFRDNLARVDDKHLADAFKTVSFSVEDMNEAIANSAHSQAKAKGATGPLSESMRVLAGLAGKVASEELSAAEALRRAEEAAASAGTQVKNLSLAYQSIGSALGGGLQGITSLASGITSLSSAFETLNNPELGTFEKYTSILMSLGTALPMTISGFKNLGNVLKFVTANQKEGLTAQLGYFIGLKNEDMKLRHVVIAQDGHTKSYYETAAAAAAAAAAKKGSTVATEIETVTTWKHIAAKAVENWHILAIVVALGALAAAIYFAVEAYNKEANAAKRAAEATKELSESQKELEDRSAKLKTTWEAYETAEKKLKECTKGTREWKEALKEVNDAAQEVLDVLPSNLSADEIKSLYSMDKGYMELDSEKVAEYQDKYDKAADAAQYATQSGKVRAALAQVEADAISAVRDLVSTQNTYVASASANGYAPIMANGELASYLSASDIKENILNNIGEWTGLSDSAFKEKLEELGVQTELLSNETLAKFQSTIEQLGGETEAASEKMRLISKLQVEEGLGENYDDTTKAVSAEKLADRTQELQNAYLELYTSNSGEVIDFGNGKTVTSTGIAKIDDENNAIYQQALADLKEAGYNYTKAQNGVQGNDNNRYFAFTDESGETVKRTAEWVAETVAASKALAELEGMAIDASAVLANMEKAVGKEQSSAIKNMITAGNLNNLTEAELSNLSDAIDTGNDGAVSADEAINYLKAAFPEQSEEEIAQMFGKNSIAEVGEMWSEVITDTGTKWGQVGNNFVENVSDSLNKLDFSELSKQETENLGNILEQAFINGGSEGMDIVSGMFNKAASSGFGDEFVNALDGIDWSSATPESLQEALKAAGVAANYGTNELENLISVMNQGGIDFQATAEKYKTVSEIIDSLKSGKSITEEQLQENFSGMEKYFSRMADGTYKLTTDAETFYDMVNKQQVEEYQKAVNEKEANNEAINNVLDYDINDLMQGSSSGGSSSGGSSSSSSGGGLVAPQGTKFAPIKMDKSASTDNDQGAKGKNTAAAQLDLLEQGGYEDQAQLKQWREDLEKGTLDAEALTLAVKEWVEAEGGAEVIQKRLTEQMAANNEEIQKYKEGIALSAMSVDDLNDKLAEGTIDIEHYDMALQNAFEQEAAAEDLDVKELTKYAEALLESKTALVETREEAYRLSMAHARMERGIDTLSDSWDSWNDIMKSGNESQKLQTLHEMKEVMSDIIGVDIKEISDDFVNSSEAMSLMQEAANGNIKALDKLSELFTRQYIADVKINNTEFKGDLQTLQNDLLKMMSQFQLEDIEIGTSLDSSGFAKDMTEMMAAAGADVETINKILAGMGFEPEVHYVEIPFEQYNQMRDQQITDWEDDGKSYTAILDSNLQTEANGKFRVPVINGSKTTFKGSASSAASNKAKKSKGSSSKPKKAKKVDKSDVVKRYKEVDDLLDDLNDKMEDTSKLADRLYGKARLNQMQKHNNLLKQEIELTKQKKQEAIKYLDEDRKALFEAASEAGTMIEIDKNGLISNYTEAMTKLYEQLDAEIASANADGNATEKEQERIDKFQDRIDALQSAIDQYDDTRELIEDLDNDLDEKFYEWQDNNYEMLTYELEIKLELNEDDLKIIDYYLNKISDDFYKMAEAAALMVGNNGVNQLTAYTDNLSNYKDYVDSLTTAYAEGGPDSEISQENYIKGLREAQDGILSNLESLNDLDETMMHYYGDTLDMAMDEISKYIDHMDHLIEVLDHYQSLMEVLGKETDYETMGIILEGKAKTLEDQAKVAKATMEMYKGEAEDRYQAYQQALLDGDQAAAELYLQQYEDALAAADEAEKDYLSRAEEWADALKAVLENKLSGFSQTLENALTGGTSFDQMTTAMERAASLQEEYLTTTNKIYETNKLMRQAQQEIDKTSNSVAKQRLKNFIEETSELQDQTELSNYELEIQKAKYDLLLAEIALEEAQNAKSIVRLQRDNEGNFGYVYTADSDAINNAEQEMLDKQNDLYNIALEGANDYNEKYQQTLNEMYDTLTDLQEQYLEGAFESEEEYHAAMEAAKEYYYEKLKQYSELHAIALVTDSRVINDAWSSDFNDMIQNTETWKDKVNEYIGNVTVAFDEWKNGIDSIIYDAGLDEIADKVGNIVSESEQLKETLIGEDGDGGIVGAINLEIEAVKDITEQYATLRGQLEEVKTAYEDIATAIGAVIKAQSQAANSKTPTVTPYDPQQGGSQTPKDTDTSGDKKGNLGGGSICPKCGKEKSKCTCDSEPKSVTITLYSTNDARGKMGTFTVDSEEDLTIGSKTNVGGPTMYSVDGLGWHGYIHKKDRDKIREVLGFATGGYTGDWNGPYGKLAFLHQKELVLNKNDTENFLASMEILERILQVIDLQSASSQIGGLLSAPGFSGNNSTLEQNVHIDAAFPNVTNSEEIEEAFNNLINLASQYAYRS